MQGCHVSCYLVKQMQVEADQTGGACCSGRDISMQCKLIDDLKTACITCGGWHASVQCKIRTRLMTSQRVDDMLQKLASLSDLSRTSSCQRAVGTSSMCVLQQKYVVCLDPVCHPQLHAWQAKAISNLSRAAGL